MGAVAVIGARTRVQGWALAGARVCAADDPASVVRAWDQLGDDVSVVLLTEAAADALAAELVELSWPLVVVIPR
jgi:vacuolar-type H+-ATPase subunit F/Vma7